jgi:hypothetical protein
MTKSLLSPTLSVSAKPPIITFFFADALVSISDAVVTMFTCGIGVCGSANPGKKHIQRLSELEGVKTASAERAHSRIDCGLLLWQWLAG